ncbi:eukaryotic translation initiation factor 4 gamma 1-like isoform X1 [Chiloscyllium punctatum]|uniref:eukaryotic translation initiation factor 4 gamma 1-like isoform X1 n=1 Tax=Chiloscyllium punctatum TaxID=137246 RepID=UPI003B63D9D6
MNKGPQPIGGPPAAPHPSPSGISQTAYPSSQTTAPVVFAPQQTPQMNTQPQPRQFAAGPRALHQQYYPNRAQQQSSASRVQSSATTRPVASATHVYPPGSQTIMMMAQQIPTYPSSGPYYVPNQFRSSFVQPAQQYPVPPGTGFYSNPNPGDYPFGTYYPATQGVQQYSTPVAPPTVMINPAQPQMPPKRERKQIRIRDPNQGGKDITEEIMSGGRSGSTPTPPQSAVGSMEGGGNVQTNGENPHPVPVIIRPDKPKSPAVAIKPVEELNKPEKSITPESVESKPELNTNLTDSEELSKVPVTEPDDTKPTVVCYDVAVTDPVQSDHDNEINPLPEPVSLPPVANEIQESEAENVRELQKEEEVIVDESSSKDLENMESNGVIAGQVDEPCENSETPLETPFEPSLDKPPEIVMDSPIAQPEELKVSNGPELSTEQDSEVLEAQQESDISPISEPEATKTEESAVDLTSEEKEEEDVVEIESQDASPTAAALSQMNDNPMQAAAVSVPKKKRKLKDLNKKEAVGDLLDAFKESQVKEPVAESDAQPAAVSVEVTETIASTRDEPEETWEEKEDKQDVENIKPDGIKLLDQKYQYKEENWKPLNPEDKKKYDREFLLGFQFIFASMQKPEGLPAISDVVLDKANKTPLRPLDPSRLTGMNCGPDFTPPFANLGRQPIGRGLPSGVGPRRSQQGPRKEPRKIIATVSLNDDIQLKKAEHAWKPSVKKPTEEDDPEMIKTQELFRKVRSILNKLTPQMFQQLMKQVADLTIDNEERLKGVIDLVFEKAISEPNFSVAYANMCRCLTTLKVPIPDKPGATVNFRKLLLNRCQKEFEKDKDDDAVIDKKQKEIDAAVMSEEKARLQEELKDARDKARRRSLGNIKFIGELFKLKMLTEPIMHDCIVKLLKNHDEESLECLCRLLTTIGKDLDFEKAKPRMDQYFNQMEKIIKERKTSSRIRFMVQDVIDLRQNNWVPRRGDQGPKTLEQIHRDAQIEEHQQQLRVQQQLLSKQDKRRVAPGTSCAGVRGSQGIDEAGWNTVPIAKNSRPIDTNRLSKITKPGAMDYNNQVLAPAGRLGGWVKGSSGGSGSKSSDTGVDSGRPATATLNRFSALQQSSSTDSFDARRVVSRSSSSRDRSEKGEREKGDRFERSERHDKNEKSDHGEKSDKSDRAEKPERSDRNRPPLTKRSYSKEVDDRSRERERRSSQEPVRRVASMTEERDRGHVRDQSRESVKLEPVSVSVTSDKPALSEEEFEKKSKAIIEEYLHINDIKEASQCVQELESPKTLHIFVRSGIESTLERSALAREHMGILLYHLVKAGTLSKEQYCKGLHEILEVAEDMEIDIPHIWQYLAELIVHMLYDGGLPMGDLFREVANPLIPIGKAGLLLADLLCLLCKGMSRKKVGSLWREGGLSWKEFLPEEKDINQFVTEKKVEFTLGNESNHEESSSKTEISFNDLCEQFDKLIKEKADNQRIFDWIEANIDEKQIVSSVFIRALMKSVCHSAVVFENPIRVDTEVVQNRVKVLTKYLDSDPQRELQALYALQALMAKLEQPPNLLRTFFDVLYDEDVISEEAFYKWESSKDPAEQQGKGVALKSVTAFFTWLREAEEESEGN